MDTQDIEWIAVDWGTSHLRAWCFGKDNALITEKHSKKGMSKLAPNQFESALLELVQPPVSTDKPIPVICCGMVGSRQGWIEAPYTTIPYQLQKTNGLTLAPSITKHLKVLIVPGIRQDNPADVMRGEETQIAGFLAHEPSFDGVLCLPGTHTKWVRVCRGAIQHFQTTMTGELFALLSEYSVLRHCMQEQEAHLDKTVFLEALNDMMLTPEDFMTRLFSLRAESLLTGLDPAVAQIRLSGFLIGMELVAPQSQTYWHNGPVVLIGKPSLCQYYALALEAQGVTTVTKNASTMTQSGLCAAYQTLKAR